VDGSFSMPFRLHDREFDSHGRLAERCAFADLVVD